MSIAMIERAARELAPFLDEVAFVGGATVALWLTDPAGPKPRVTKDVDVVVEVATRVAWYRFEERLRAHGLRNDTSSPVICRWRAGGPGDELVIDLMPGDAAILDFENRWQKPALDHAKDVSLLSGQQIRAIPPPYLLATKLEAWNGRAPPLDLLLERTAELLDALALCPLDRALLEGAGALAEPALRPRRDPCRVRGRPRSGWGVRDLRRAPGRRRAAGRFAHDVSRRLMPEVTGSNPVRRAQAMAHRPPAVPWTGRRRDLTAR